MAIIIHEYKPLSQTGKKEAWLNNIVKLVFDNNIVLQIMRSVRMSFVSLF